MIIRSQDKKTITDDLKLYIRENDFIRDKVKWEIRNAEQDLLATYSTEEKAIKVLDMIQQKFLQYGTIESGFNTESIFVIPRCFQMPSDEEVEV